MNDSLQQCLASIRGKIYEQNFWGINLSQRGQNRAQNFVFGDFLKFGSLLFLEAACNDSLEQCIISSRGKIHGKTFWAHIWTKGAKIGPKTSFLPFFKFGSLFFLEITYNDSLH